MPPLTGKDQIHPAATQRHSITAIRRSLVSFTSSVFPSSPPPLLWLFARRGTRVFLSILSLTALITLFKPGPLRRVRST
jgi:hypothetical protein